ncbi:MAG: drug/metabolite transporter (DMT)-like permease [Cryomorphaceae bacterium]|jgi:drug/metabolite transporter (DMT)-like permease
MPLRYIIELVVLAAIWGASFLFLRIAAPEFGPIALIEVRVFIASVFLLPIWYFADAKKQMRLVKQHWLPLLMVGILNSAIPFVLFAYATLYVTGGFASILNSTAPIWGSLVAWLWLSQKPNFSSALGLGIGLLGVIVLVAPNIQNGLDSSALGALAAALASILYGIAANYASEKLNRVSALSIATFSQIAATLVLLPFALNYFPNKPISALSWACVFGLGVFCTGMAYTMYFRLIASIGSSKAITVTFLIPIFGTFWGAVFINEEISLRMIVGMLIILCGTALVTGVIALRKPAAN